MRQGGGKSDLCDIQARGPSVQRWTWFALFVALTLPGPAGASEPRIVVTPLIVAELASEPDFDIKVEPTGPLTAETLLIISGLPKPIAFSAGDAIAPGVWQVPVQALQALKMVVPPGEPSRSDLLFVLVKKEGKGVIILASSRSVMVVDSPSAAARAKQLEDARSIEAARAEEQRRLAAAKAAEDERLAQIRQAEDARKVAEARAEELRHKLAAVAAEEERQKQARDIEEEAARAEQQRRLAAAKAVEEERLAQIRQAEDARKAAEAKAEELRHKLAAVAAEEERLKQAGHAEEKASKAEEQRQRVARPGPADTYTASVPAEQAIAATRLIKRGDEQLGQGNILTARQYFLRAAQAGLANAAFKLAETHDPHELARWTIHSVRPDLTEAKAWYTRALHLGIPEARARLARLGE